MERGNEHAVCPHKCAYPIPQLSLQEAEDLLHGTPDVLELALLTRQIVGCAASEEGLERHVVGKRDGRIEFVDMQKVADEALLADDERSDLDKCTTESLEGKYATSALMNWRQIKEKAQTSLPCIFPVWSLALFPSIGFRTTVPTRFMDC